MTQPERIFSEGLVLPDGRKVRILSYNDGSVRFRLEGAPYVIAEAFIGAGRNDHAIIKLVPVGSSESERNEPEAELRNQLDEIQKNLEVVKAKMETGDRHRSILPEPEEGVEPWDGFDEEV